MSASLYCKQASLSVRDSGRGGLLCRGFGLSGLWNQTANEPYNSDVVDTMT